MSGYHAAEASHAEGTVSGVSVPLVVASALLIGLGLFGMAYFFLTSNLLYFAALIPLLAGAILLFTRATGPDHA